jgi:hypothetical protein
MDKAVEFDLLPDDTTDITNTCPILIKNGKFKDIVYRYGKISFEELESGSLNVNMDIEIIKAPVGFDKTQEDFTKTVGDIFVQIVEQQVTTFDGQDLEADVHQDPLDRP